MSELRFGILFHLGVVWFLFARWNSMTKFNHRPVCQNLLILSCSFHIFMKRF